MVAVEVTGERLLIGGAPGIQGYNHDTGITVELRYVNLDILKPHERYIENRVLTILESLRRTGYLIRPLIVDSVTGTVIDGAHRLEALKRLGASRAPVLLIDYMREEEVKVDRWIRIYKGPPELLSKLLRALSESIPGVIIRDRGYTLYSIRGSVRAQAYRVIDAIESTLTGLVVEFKDRIPVNARNAIIVDPPPLSKNDVVEAALNNKPYPPKTTRHVTILKGVTLKTRVVDLLKL